MPRIPKGSTSFKKDGTQTWHSRFSGAYKPQPGDVIIPTPDDISPYVRIVDTDPNPPKNRPASMKRQFRYQIHFTGTKPHSLNQWKQNYAAAIRGARVPEWDRVIDYVRDRYGYDSRNGRNFSHPAGVHYTGFSRGSPLSMFLGGSGYGLGSNPFPAYPPFYGSDHHKVHDWYALWVHDWFLTEHAPGNMEWSSQSDMGKYGKRPPDQTAVTDGGSSKHPVVEKEEYIENTTYLMPADDPRNPWTYAVQIRRYRDGRYYFDVNASGEAPWGIEEWDGTRGPAVPGQSYGNYDDLAAIANSQDPGLQNDADMTDDDPSTPVVTQTAKRGALGDFSGLVATFLNPITSRIIGYKGIPRKRKFGALTRYSQFWEKQLEPTPTSVLAGPS